MAHEKLDPKTSNVDTGVFITNSGPIAFTTADVTLPEISTYIKSVSGGTVIWHDSLRDLTGSWNLEAGETFYGRFDKIIATATVGGIAETTAAGTYYWGATASSFVPKAVYS